MSTITAPSTGAGNRPTSRTPYVIAAALLGVVAVGVVVGPRLGTSSGTATTTAMVNQHDAVEHRGADLKAATVPDLETLPQSALPQGMTRAYVGSQLALVPIPQLVGRSTIAQQTGAIGHYTYTPQRLTRYYRGSMLVTEYEPAVAAPGAVTGSTAREQVGGATPTYPYLPEIATSHMGWSDTWVPPYNNPEWVPFIKAHYFHPATTTPPTHEYR